MSHSLRPHGLYSPCNSPGQNTGVGSLSLLQGIFPTQSPALQADSLPAEPQGSKWVAYSFTNGSSWPSNWTGVSCIAGGFFTNWVIRELINEIHFLSLLLPRPRGEVVMVQVSRGGSISLTGNWCMWGHRELKIWLHRSQSPSPAILWLWGRHSQLTNGGRESTWVHDDGFTPLN